MKGEKERGTISLESTALEGARIIAGKILQSAETLGQGFLCLEVSQTSY